MDIDTSSVTRLAVNDGVDGELHKLSCVVVVQAAGTPF